MIKHILKHVSIKNTMTKDAYLTTKTITATTKTTTIITLCQYKVYAYSYKSEVAEYIRLPNHNNDKNIDNASNNNNNNGNDNDNNNNKKIFCQFSL